MNYGVPSSKLFEHRNGVSSSSSTSASSLPTPKVHNIPIHVDRDYNRRFLAGSAPRPYDPKSGQQFPLAKYSEHNSVGTPNTFYYPPRRVFGPREGNNSSASKIPMARQNFGNLSLTDRLRFEDSNSHLRRGSADDAPHPSSSLSYPTRRPFPPMSYNLRESNLDGGNFLDRNQPHMVASYHHHPPTVDRHSGGSRTSPSSFGQREVERSHDSQLLPVQSPASATSRQSQAQNSVDSDQVPQAQREWSGRSKSKATHVISETDILYSSSSEGEDDVVRGCDQEGASHQEELDLINRELC